MQKDVVAHFNVKHKILKDPKNGVTCFNRFIGRKGQFRSKYIPTYVSIADHKLISQVYVQG